MASCRPEKVDYAIIAFEKELPLLKLLAKSFSVYGEGVGQVFIIINDEQPDALFFRINNEVKPLFGDLESAVDIIKGGELTGRKPTFGYQAQQALKLLISSHVTSSVYVCLDCKNHFTSPFGVEDWVSESGKVRMRRLVTGKAHQGYLRNSMATFDIHDFDVSQPTPPTVTPYVMYAGVARKTIEWVEDKYGTSLLEFLESKEGRRRTEFFLYYSALFSSTRDIDDLVDWSGWASQTLFPKWPPPGSEVALNKIKNAGSGENMLGIHRRRFSSLTEEEVDEITRLWVKCNLVNSLDGALSIVNDMIEDDDSFAS